tara:strand:+ start:507 stop:770 length:264 start_codon:yes stop_codon:yes gene_type:complete
MKKHYYVIILAILSFIIAIFDTSAGIYIAVLANVVANVITLSRQKAQIVKIKKKKERPLTVDELRQREMEANPHRPYPRYQEGDVYK